MTVETRADHSKNCDIQHEVPDFYHHTFSFRACFGKLQNASCALVCGLTKYKHATLSFELKNLGLYAFNLYG
jgi:hypothetical protein